MSGDEFDPYLEWLGIPPQRRPPTYYDLLGLAAFESDADCVKQAALERINLVRQYKVGRREDAASNLERELTQAWDCLQDPRRKCEYDATLRGASTLHAATQQTSSESSLPVAAEDSEANGMDMGIVEHTVVEVQPAAEDFVVIDPDAELGSVSTTSAADTGWADANDVIEATLVSRAPQSTTCADEGTFKPPPPAPSVDGSSPVAPVGASAFATVEGPSVLRAVGDAFIKLATRARHATPRTRIMGALTICLALLAIVLVTIDRGRRVSSLPQPIPQPRDLPSAANPTRVWERSLASMELVDSSGASLGHATTALLDPGGLCVFSLRGLERGIPRQARTPQGATLFFWGALPLDSGARLAVARTGQAGTAVHPLPVSDIWPSPGTIVRLAWCAGASAAVEVVSGKLVRGWEGKQLSDQCPGAEAWLANSGVWLLEVDVGDSTIPAGAIALNGRQEVVGICVITRRGSTQPCLLLPGSRLYQLLDGARTQSVLPLDEFSEQFTSIVRAADGPAAAGVTLPAHDLELEALLAAVQLGSAPKWFAPLRVDDAWTLSWESLYGPRHIFSWLQAVDCGDRVIVLASENPHDDMSYIGHVRNKKLHGWVAALSVDGVLRCLTQFKNGEHSGKGWFYDRQGQLVLWFDQPDESRLMKIFLVNGRPSVLSAQQGSDLTRYRVEQTATGFQLRALASGDQRQEREYRQSVELWCELYAAELTAMLIDLQSMVMQRAAALGY